MASRWRADFEAIEFGDPGDLDVLGLQRVEKLGERLREAARLMRCRGDLLREPRRRMGGRPFIDQVHQQQQLARHADRRAEIVDAMLGLQQVLVDVAQRPDARQQHAGAAGEAEEDVLQLAHRAAGGQQDGPAREFELAGRPAVGTGKARSARLGREPRGRACQARW